MTGDNNQGPGWIPVPVRRHPLPPQPQSRTPSELEDKVRVRRLRAGRKEAEVHPGNRGPIPCWRLLKLVSVLWRCWAGVGPSTGLCPLMTPSPPQCPTSSRGLTSLSQFPCLENRHRSESPGTGCEDSVSRGSQAHGHLSVKVPAHTRERCSGRTAPASPLR